MARTKQRTPEEMEKIKHMDLAYGLKQSRIEEASRCTHVVVHGAPAGMLRPIATLTVVGAPAYRPADDMEKLTTEMEEVREESERIKSLHDSIKKCNNAVNPEVDWLSADSWKALASGDPAPAVAELRGRGLNETFGEKLHDLKASLKTSELASKLTIAPAKLVLISNMVVTGPSRDMFDGVEDIETERLLKDIKARRRDVHINVDVGAPSPKRARED